VQKYPPILLIFEVYMHICLQFVGTSVLHTLSDALPLDPAAEFRPPDLLLVPPLAIPGYAAVNSQAYV